ncbi:aminotransferase class V-fold PLP-dependent enzyme [Limnochorda pilosa]|uniref:L-seryl-tRNA selenium transferase n=1 Tax=Limnochorda pilosa TaxID=1555112 RepID=A0A0K2SLS4_LIMPI|nr:aminotransferase class V-fold PLP-dependent enzyme [Limnochorda pilosa]BAS28055.1 hypothetical protein LIP_2214 [Limnochorda pilosa]
MAVDLVSWLQEHRVINASGTMTDLGASSVPEDVARLVMESLRCFVDMHALQAMASSVIVRATGAEAGCVTGSAAGGVAVAVAGCMTGSDLGAIESLPDTSALSRRVIIQKGHVVNFGVPISQVIRLTGAEVLEIGSATDCRPYQLEHALDRETAAVVYVVSHHTVQSGLLPLGDVARIARQAGVPVIVDAASEYDLRSFIGLGADLAVYSAHKFLAGPTAGIVAGRKDLVRAAYLNQVRGIGRAMKVGKEGIVGAVAALERWLALDHGAQHEAEYRRVRELGEGMERIPGLRAVEVPDPTGNPITRVRVHLDGPNPGRAAAALAQALRTGSPPVAVRDHHVDLGYFELDPCNLLEGDVPVILERMAQSVREGVLKESPSPAPEPVVPGRLGPRRSTYTPDGLPCVDVGQVPWAGQGIPPGGREQALLDWPDAYLGGMGDGGESPGS